MNKRENLHVGHRERIVNKLIENPSTFNDHEILELLLFCCIPRVDTNPLAHRILNTFGSLSGVVNSSPKKLMSINGVGKKTASFLVAIGKVLERIKNDNSQNKKMFSLYEIRQLILSDFSADSEEKVIIYLLDKKYNKIASLTFEDKELFYVSLDIPELANAIALHKPRFAIMAHNHPSGNVKPSHQDDKTTKKVHLVCSLHGVELCDHIIVSKDQVYSYYHDGNLEEIKNNNKIEKIFN